MNPDDWERVAAATGPDLDPADQRDLIRYLLGLGATEADLRESLGRLAVGGVALDLAFRRGTPRPFAEVATEAGLVPARAARLWRTLGFPDPARNGTRLDDGGRDVLALVAAASTVFGDDAVVGLARVAGNSSATLAQAVVDTFRVRMESPQTAAGAGYTGVVKSYTALATELLPRLNEALGVLILRHLVAAASSQRLVRGRRRRDGAAGPVRRLRRHLRVHGAVGVVDATRARAGARRVRGRRHGRRGSPRVRVVKLLGDGAMFAADDATTACRVGSALVASATATATAPVRVGAAAGKVVTLSGDLYGPVVNLAARLVSVAPPNSVLVDGVIAARAADDLRFDPLPPQQLKGVAVETAPFLLRLE